MNINNLERNSRLSFQSEWFQMVCQNTRAKKRLREAAPLENKHDMPMVTSPVLTPPQDQFLSGIHFTIMQASCNVNFEPNNFGKIAGVNSKRPFNPRKFSRCFNDYCSCNQDGDWKWSWASPCCIFMEFGSHASSHRQVSILWQISYVPTGI